MNPEYVFTYKWPFEFENAWKISKYTNRLKNDLAICPHFAGIDQSQLRGGVREREHRTQSKSSHPSETSRKRLEQPTTHDFGHGSD